ncbi:Protein of unknown function [Pyronema omphalodes CBS 100304]|uniref:Uncharacterized protein n=1 Tax=Pyronema omphalodes (strain CBS 100304) TaxID=1076935 RepID=U4L096_PYROM|nr:Protein of unknown function [Pyronema omphalodes CBS 100304]
MAIQILYNSSSSPQISHLIPTKPETPNQKTNTFTIIMPNSSNPPPAPRPSHRELPGEPREPGEPGEPGGGDKSTSSSNKSKEAVDKLPTFGTGGAPKRPETNPASQRPKTPKTYADLVATERRGGGSKK